MKNITTNITNRSEDIIGARLGYSPVAAAVFLFLSFLNPLNIFKMKNLLSLFTCIIMMMPSQAGAQEVAAKIDCAIKGGTINNTHKNEVTQNTSSDFTITNINSVSDKIGPGEKISINFQTCGGFVQPVECPEFKLEYFAINPEPPVETYLNDPLCYMGPSQDCFLSESDIYLDDNFSELGDYGEIESESLVIPISHSPGVFYGLNIKKDYDTPESHSDKSGLDPFFDAFLSSIRKVGFTDWTILSLSILLIGLFLSLFADRLNAKRITTIIAFSLITSTSAFGQCGVNEPIGDPIPLSLKPAYNSFMNNPFFTESTDTIPVKIHVVRTNSGSGGISTSNLTAAFNTANNFFSNANMYFKFCGSINYIDNTNLYDFDQNDESIITSANNVQNVVNIYFFNSITSSSNTSLCGYAYFPGGPDVIMMKNSCTTSGNTLSHELGHYFNLYHTHSTSNGVEYVNGSNSSSTGDLLVDTDADPQLSYSTVNTSCNYTGNATDPNNDPYNPDPHNIMSYSRHSCRNIFSPLQYARMSWANTNLRSYLNCGSVTTSGLNCASAVQLTCGVNYTGPYSSAPSNVGSYGCNWWTETGPERVHKITPSANGTLTATISNFTGDLDVFILGSCDPNDCLGTVNPSSATFTNAIANHTYYIVVDADDGSGSGYDLMVTCSGSTSSGEDITLSNMAILTSTSVAPGGTVDVEVEQNYSGTSNSVPNVYVHYVLSTDCIYDAGDVYLDDDYSTIDAGDLSDLEGQILTIPNSTLPGTYYILCVADATNVVTEINENNNTSCMQIAVTGSSSGEDITLSNMAILTSTSVAPGGTVDVEVEQNYSGTSNSVPNVYVHYVLSTDCIYDAGDVYLDDDYSTIDAGDLSDLEGQILTIPNSTLPGTYYILCVADATNVVTEINENNNTSCMQITVVSPCTPITPPLVSTNGSNCTGPSVNYTQTGLTTSNPHTWYVSSGGTIQGSNVQNSVVINWSSIGAQQVFLVYYDNCNMDTVSLSVNIAAGPINNSSIVGNQTPCSGQSEIYQVSTYSGTPQWSVSGNATINGSNNLSMVNITANGPATLSFHTTTIGCGNSSPVTVNLNPIGVPSAPNPIIGNATVCQGSNQAYSITGISGTAVWSTTGGISIQGSNVGNSIQTTVSGNGSVFVIDSISCGNSAQTSLAISTTQPPTNLVINGTNTSCQNVTEMFNVGTIPNGYNISWTATGATIVGPSNGVQVSVQVGTTNYSVSAVLTGCTNLNANKSVIVASAPTSPTSITGDFIPCVNNLSTYSTTVQSGVTANWTVTGGNIIGSSSGTSVDVIWTASSGTLSVVATNTTCNLSSSVTNANVLTSSAPSMPTLVGATTPCYGQIETYTFNTIGTPIVSVIGGQLLNVSSSSLDVLWTGTTGIITLSDSTNCGVSSVFVLNNINISAPPSVSLTSFPMVATNQTITLTSGIPTGGIYFGSPGILGANQFDGNLAGPGNHTVGYTLANSCGADTAWGNIQVVFPTGIEDVEKDAIAIYPNPVNGLLNISGGSKVLDGTDYKIYNGLSQVILKGTINSQQIEVTNLASGLYYLKIDGYDKMHKFQKL